MSEVSQLIRALKKELKRQGMSYRAVAQSLNLSEASVKRCFASGKMSLDRLAQLCQLLGLSLAELAQQAQAETILLSTLSHTQEAQLVADLPLLLVATCALNHWTIADITTVYQLSEAQCVLYLLQLDRMGLLHLLPNNRIRVLVARDFEWLPNGPIRLFFRQQCQDDFLNSPFTSGKDVMAFTHGMLSAAAAAEFRLELAKLRQKFAELHDKSANLPRTHKEGFGLLLALRAWEPAGFAALRKK